MLYSRSLLVVCFKYSSVYMKSGLFEEGTFVHKLEWRGLSYGYLEKEWCREQQVQRPWGKTVLCC